MDAETDYIEYVISFSLSILAVSAVYFLNLRSPITYISLIMIPLLYGYTAYISRNGFKRSSLLSGIGLFFIPLGPVMAVAGILITFGNPLVSIFSGGEEFHDYFRSVSIPLLITGVLIGFSAFYMMSSQPDLKENTVNKTAEALGERTASMARTTDLVGNYQETQTEIIEQTSKASIANTQAYVLNETADELSSEQIQSVNTAFLSAQQDIPRQMSQRVQNQSQQKTQNMESTVTDAYRNALQHPNAELALIPIAAIFIYGLNPIIGMLTSIFASFFQYIDRKYDVFPPT